MNIELTTGQLATIWRHLQQEHTLHVYGLSYEEIFRLAEFYEKTTGNDPHTILAKEI